MVTTARAIVTELPNPILATGATPAERVAVDMPNINTKLPFTPHRLISINSASPCNRRVMLALVASTQRLVPAVAAHAAASTSPKEPSSSVRVHPKTTPSSTRTARETGAHC